MSSRFSCSGGCLSAELRRTRFGADRRVRAVCCVTGSFASSNTALLLVEAAAEAMPTDRPKLLRFLRLTRCDADLGPPSIETAAIPAARVAGSLQPQLAPVTERRGSNSSSQSEPSRLLLTVAPGYVLRDSGLDEVNHPEEVILRLAPRPHLGRIDATIPLCMPTPPVLSSRRSPARNRPPYPGVSIQRTICPSRSSW